MIELFNSLPIWAQALALLFGPSVVGMAAVAIFAVVVLGTFYNGHGGWCMPWNQPRD